MRCSIDAASDISRDRFVGQQPLLVDQAVERRAGDAPGIALVLDEIVHNGERAAALAFDQFERAKQRGRIFEMRHVGQETADLDLGMDAGGDTAQDLHDIFVLDQRRC